MKICGQLTTVSAPRCKSRVYLQAEGAVRRFATLLKVLLLATVMLIGVGTPGTAKPAAASEGARIERVEKKKSFSFTSWFKGIGKLIARYAMAAS